MVLAVVFLVLLAVGVVAAVVTDLKGRRHTGDVDLGAVRHGQRKGLKNEPPAPPAGSGGLGV